MLGLVTSTSPGASGGFPEQGKWLTNRYVTRAHMAIASWDKVPGEPSGLGAGTAAAFQ